MARFKDRVKQFGNWVKTQVVPLTPWGVARSNTDKTIAANRELAEYQYSKDVEMWNRANAYNAPEAQMGRLKDAGLNPNMVYGSGSAAGNTAGQLPKYNAPSQQYNYSPLAMPQLLSMFQDFRMRNAQTDNVRAQTESLQGFRNPLLKQQASLVNRQGFLTTQKSGTESIKQGLMSGIQPYQLEMAKQGARSAQLRNEGVVLDNIWKTFQNDWRKLGITDKDNLIVRSAARMWNEFGSPWFEQQRSSGFPSMRRKGK